MKKIVSWISVLALLTVAMAFPASATEVEVRNVTELVNAVKTASKGDVIKVYPGDYNIPQDETTVVEGQAGWYLPIEANNITIVGVDESGNEITDPANAVANLYSTDYSPNESWAVQNLITVFGDNVTMKGLVVMNKIAANKALEVYADGFTIENCTFAPIAERMLEGLEPDNLGGYVYNEYKEYGASLYFNAHANAVVKNNIFQNSNLTLSEDLTGTMEITGNTFSGVKNWNNDPENTYSAIGYTSWANPPVTDITDADITIEENIFENAGAINFSKVKTGSVDVSNNYWGGEAPAEDKLMGPVTVKNYYTDEAMTEKAWTADATKNATPETFAQVMEEANEGDLIILGAGEYTDSLKVTKGVTIQAEDGATVDGIDIQADNVTIDGVTFDGIDNSNLDVRGTSIYIQGDKTNITVKNCTFALVATSFDDRGKGIVTESGVSKLTVENNTFNENYETAVYLNPITSNVVLSDNEVNTTGFGFRLVGSDTVSIIDNSFDIKTRGEDENLAIQVRKDWSAEPCKSFTITGNIFSDNSNINFYDGALAYGGEKLDLSQNYWGGGLPSSIQLLEEDENLVILDSYYKTLDAETGTLSDLVALPDEEDVVDGEVVFVQNGTKVDVYLEGRFDGQPAVIQNFIDLEMTLNLAVTEGNLAIESIAPGEDMVVVPQGDNTYLIRKVESNDVVITSDSIHLGTLTLGGFGKGTIGLDSEKPAKMEREINDSIAVTGNITATNAEISFEEEKVTLTINVAFNNNITAGNTADYNDFTITVTDAKGVSQVYKLGKTTDTGEFGVQYIADYTAENATIAATVTKGYRYSIEAQGVGYRTYRTSVLADGNKTVNLWNNVKDTEAEVTTGVSATKNFLAGDIVMDNVINLYDLSAVVSYFGKKDIDVSAASQYARYDLNRDGKIDSKDVAMVLVSWEE